VTPLLRVSKPPDWKLTNSGDVGSGATVVTGFTVLEVVVDGVAFGFRFLWSVSFSQTIPS
jgi:hypothetical protein